jgi:glycosyltransferase involved in cell wall biosynthesis
MPDPVSLQIAVVVPCHNEEQSIGTVVRDFSAHLPGASVYVYDNCSTDATFERAAESNAIVRREPKPGKGNVVRRMLADIDADVYVLVDGDDTYDASVAPAMVTKLCVEQLDMVIGVREADDQLAAYRKGHVLGNRAFNVLHRRLFGGGVTDVFSGYRVLSRRFAKTFPASSSGFEIEAEMTAHALDIGAPIGELVCRYRERSDGSASKLRTYRDGTRILLRSFLYFKELRPFRFFTTIAAAFLVLSLAFGVPVIVEFARTSKVPRFPTAFLSVGLALVGVVAASCAVILDSLARGRREAKRLAYLAHAPVAVAQARAPVATPTGATGSAPAGHDALVAAEHE